MMSNRQLGTWIKTKLEVTTAVKKIGCFGQLSLKITLIGKIFQEISEK